MRNTHCTYEEREVIERLLKEGRPHAEIAKAINRCPAFIGFEVRRAGGHETYTAKDAQAGADKRIHRMKTWHRKELSAEQIQSVEEGIKGGYSQHKIRELAGVSMARTSRYLRENHPNYRSKRRTTHFSFNDRLESIESQIEIISDTIRRIHEQNNENRRLFDLQKTSPEPSYRCPESQEDQELHQDQ